MAGYLNEKHTDWNYRLTKARGSLLRDYAIRNTSDPWAGLQTTASNTQRYPRRSRHSGCQGLRPTGVSVSSALSSDHLPILIDTTGRSSFQNLLDRPDFT
jgi:hypothetical protein